MQPWSLFNCPDLHTYLHLDRSGMKFLTSRFLSNSQLISDVPAAAVPELTLVWDAAMMCSDCTRSFTPPETLAKWRVGNTSYAVINSIGLVQGTVKLEELTNLNMQV